MLKFLQYLSLYAYKYNAYKKHEYGLANAAKNWFIEQITQKILNKL